MSKGIVLTGFQLLDAGDTILVGKIDGEKVEKEIAFAVTTEDGDWKATLVDGGRISLKAEFAAQDCYIDGDYSYCVGGGANEGKPFYQLKSGDSVYVSRDGGSKWRKLVIERVRDLQTKGWKCLFVGGSMLYLDEVQDNTTLVEKGVYLYSTAPELEEK